MPLAEPDPLRTAQVRNVASQKRPFKIMTNGRSAKGRRQHESEPCCIALEETPSIPSSRIDSL